MNATSEAGASVRSELWRYTPMPAGDDTGGSGRLQEPARYGRGRRQVARRSPQSLGGVPRGARPPGLERRLDDRPRGRDQGSRRGPGRRPAPRGSTRPPWAPTPGNRNTARGIACAQARRAGPRLGRGDHGAHVGQAADPHRPAPSSSTSAGQPVAQRQSCRRARPGSRRRPGWRCAPARTCRRPRHGPPRRCGSSESRPSSGLTVTASAPSPSTSPQGVGGGAEQRLGVGGCGVRDVAALAVGEHQQARLARRGRPPRRAPAIRARRGARSRPAEA